MCVVFTFHKSTVGHIVVKVSNLPMLLYFENIDILIIEVVWWKFAFSCFIDRIHYYLYYQPTSPGYVAQAGLIRKQQTFRDATERALDSKTRATMRTRFSEYYK